MRHSYFPGGLRRGRISLAYLVLTLVLGPAAATDAVFVDAAQSTGLDFTHFNGQTGQLYMVEVMGAGGGLLDYDNDGDLDVYLVQGRPLPKTPTQATEPAAADSRYRDRLYRNDLHPGPDGRPVLHFTDVTASSGINATGYGMGVAAGDIDNDGDVDIYVTNFGANQLYRNNGDGSFTDVTAAAGVGDPDWSVSAAFLDYDRDGWLDLYVGNYVDFSVARHKPCYAPTSLQDYCSPQTYRPLSDRLYHNRGDGTFEDVSAKAHIVGNFGGALGVSVADFNGDGWPDIYVANDGTPNLLWINRKDGTFSDEAFMAGAAVDMHGSAQASMGVDAGDFDGDGDDDLFMTHILGETNTIYVNDGKGWFEDRSAATRLGAPSQGYTAFGTAWIDYDNDGWLDLLVVNGAVDFLPAPGKPLSLAQPNELFANQRDGTFRDVTTSAGAIFVTPEVSRGAAFGDVDNDGDTDVLVTANNGPARLLLNQVGNHNHWLGLRLLDRAGRDAYGARVAVSVANITPRWRRAHADGSYAATNDPRVLVGLDGAARSEGIQVLWPDGKREQWPAPPVNRYTVLRQGQGREVAAP
jgi:hypothetical protein